MWNWCKEFWLMISDQVPSYIESGKRQTWLDDQEKEFIPYYVSERDKDLWNKTADKCAATGQLLKFIVAKEKWKSFI